MCNLCKYPSSYLLLKSHSISAQGFSLEYPHIAMHAIHKNAAEFPRPNLYLIIDVRLVDSDGTPTPESSHHGSDNEDEGDPDPGITEIRCVNVIRLALFQLLILLVLFHG